MAEVINNTTSKTATCGIPECEEHHNMNADEPQQKEPIKEVPVTILTGFLGSGKTTLLNRILEDKNHGLRFAIIENEFGEIGVDERILSEETNEEVIEVMNGCICCTVRGDLVVALKRLYDKVAQFDAVIIETTGLADPAPVAQTFFLDDWIQDHFKLDAIITVVDAKHIMLRLDEEKPPGVENEAVEQVAFADRILLNKTDLVTDEAELLAIEKRIRRHNTDAQIYRTKQSEIDPKLLININAFDIANTLEMEPGFLNNEEHEHEHDPHVSSTSVKLAGYLNVNKLNNWIGGVVSKMGAELYRYKGLLNCAGTDYKFVFQGVGMLFGGGFTQAKWSPDEERESRFVFIGRDLDKDRLIDGILDCQCSPELRFKAGDKVKVNIGSGTIGADGKPAPPKDEYAPGTVLETWVEGSPYVVQVDGDEENIFWCPEDSDAKIQAGEGTVAAEILPLEPRNVTIKKGDPPKKKK